jgi:TDG/mug DNA glycosylase family protein
VSIASVGALHRRYGEDDCRVPLCADDLAAHVTQVRGDGQSNGGNDDDDGYHVLPDVLAAGIDIVFCGTAPGTVSAARRAYYAGPGNAFWQTLFAVGLTPHRLLAEDFRSVTRWSLGLTDLAKRVSGSDSDLRPAHFDVERLRGVIRQYQPRIVAFTSKRAAEEFLGHRVAYGALAETCDATGLFVLPSPSGAARRYWDQQYWQALADLRVRLAASRGEQGVKRTPRLFASTPPR